MNNLNRSLVRHLIAAAIYLIAAIIITWPLVTQLGDVLVGFVHGDAGENAHHIWWFGHALRTGQSLFFQSMLGYPDGIEGVTLWAHPLQFFPAWLLALILPLPTAANLTLLLMMTLNGWAMFALARLLINGTGGAAQAAPASFTRDLAALIAGLVFMLYPTMQGHLGAGHAGLMVQWGVPLYAICLIRLSGAKTRRDLIGWFMLGVLTFMVSAFGHSLQAIYVLLPLTTVFVLRAVLRHEWTAAGRIIAVAGVGALALGIFLLPVLREAFGTSVYADEGGSVRYSADLLSIATPSFRHPLVESWEYPRRVLGVNLDEGAAYYGIAVLALTVIAAWKVRAARPWLWLALIAYVLALGELLKVFDQPVVIESGGYRSYIPLPYALIADLPGFSIARTPGRFIFTLALAAAALAGFGSWVLLRRLKSPLIRVGIAAVVMVVIAFEYQTFFPLPTFSAAIPNAIRDLRDQDDVRAVFDVPYDNLIVAKLGLYLQTAHEQPLIAGQVTRSTPVNPALLTLLQDSLDPALLHAAGADVVLVHRGYDAGGVIEARARQQLGEPVYTDAAYALFETPETDAERTPVPPQFRTTTLPSTAYSFSVDDGWWQIDGQLRAIDGERTAVLLLDGRVIGRWDVTNAIDISLPVPASEGSYQTLTLALEPPCPTIQDESLACRTITIESMNISFVHEVEDSAPIAYQRGITLEQAGTGSDDDGNIIVRLAWLFDAPLSEIDIRYVHLIDPNGQLAAQSDVTLGEIAAGEMRAEQVTLTRPSDIITGLYTIRVGWYTYPEIAPICPLAAADCTPAVIADVLLSE